MIYLRAALYAEGSDDYYFLLRLLDRLLEAIAASLYPGAYEVGPAIGIDAPEPARRGKRVDRITAAAREHDGLFELLIIHADGAGDPKAAREFQVDPAIAALAEASLEFPVFAVPCVPVREIEAWTLTDAVPFRDLLGRSASPPLPADPERIDPKATLKQILQQAGVRLTGPVYSLFGERTSLDSLRTLPAFRTFESDLTKAIRSVAGAQGHHPPKHGR